MKSIQIGRLAIVAASLSLAACGSGSSSEPEVKTDPVVTQPTPQIAATITGKAIDGYVSGATVFLDLNGNSQLDDNEPSSVTGEAGEYALDLSASEYECRDFVPIVLDVPVGAVDEDLGVVEEAYQMVFPPMATTATEGVHITPLTTALYEVFKDRFLVTDDEMLTPTMACDAVRDNIEMVDRFEQAIDFTIDLMVEEYNIAPDTLFSDFIASGDLDTAAYAQLMVKGLKKSLEETLDAQEANPNAYVYVTYLREGGQWVRKHYTAETSAPASSWSLYANISSSVSSVSDDLEVVGGNLYGYSRSSVGKTLGSDVIEIGSTNEACTTSESYNYYDSRGGNAVNEYEIINFRGSCGEPDSKTILFYEWSDHDALLGHTAQYIIKSDDESGDFLALAHLKDFNANRDVIDTDYYNSEISALGLHYDDGLEDSSSLWETYQSVALTKTVRENGNKVVYYKQTEEDQGWSYKTTRYNSDGTWTAQCRDAGSSNWYSCQ